MFRTQRGMNLIEVLITLGVLGVLISLGAPGFAEWLQAQRIRAAAESLTNGMQVSRGEAIRRNLPVSFGLEPPVSTWTACEATVIPCDSTTPAGKFIQNKSGAESGGNARVKATPDGAILVTFSALGAVVANPDGSDTIQRLDVIDPSAVCNADGGSMRCLRIVVTPGGSIRMCDPTPTIVAPDPRACP